VVITWANGGITKKWLEVGVLPTAPTGLVASDTTVDPDGPGEGTPVAVGDVFFFGNAVGGSGDGDTVNAAPTNASDELGARNNPHNLANPALVTDFYDYNKNRFVDANDQLIARNNPTNLSTQLVKINVGTGGAYAPESDGDTGIASALASTVGASSSAEKLPAAIAYRLESVAVTASPASLVFARLQLEEPQTDDVEGFLISVVDVDDELLETLATSVTG
jgi:hypothetical protein